MKGRFKVAPLPEFDGGGQAGVLGGADVVISAYAENPGGALALLDYITGPEHAKRGRATAAW